MNTGFAKIVGTGIYVPEQIVTNADLSCILGEDINPFVTSVLGIHERHVCAENESTAAISVISSRLKLIAVPKLPDPLTSISNITVSSRSSSKTFT